MFMQVILSEKAGQEEEKRLARKIPAWIRISYYEIMIGWQGVYALGNW